MENLQYLSFVNINVHDSFFDSLKADYAEFESWFGRKSNSGAAAYVLHIGSVIDGFMYLKTENGTVGDIEPELGAGKHLKVGTFKFNSHGTRRGERFIRKIFDHAISQKVDDIYVTVFEKHDYLMHLFIKYGFKVHGSKETPNGIESVLVRSMNTYLGAPLQYYPYINTFQNRKHMLSIQPQFHSRMLPDSILNNETHDIIQDVSHTNSIHKIYICAMDGVASFRPGDPIVIYRTSDNQGPARFRSVATSVGVMEEYKNINEFLSEADFLKYCASYSVFSNEELTTIFRRKRYCHIIRFTYNSAFTKRVTRGCLIDSVGLNENDYWGVMDLTDVQFRNIIRLGGIDESTIIN